MVDENKETSGKAGARSGEKEPAGDRGQAAMSGSDKGGNSQRRRRRRRRSLFSLLFTSGNQQTAEGGSSSDDEPPSALPIKDEDREPRLRGARRAGDRHTRRRNQDVVLIKPCQAKCVEATVVSLVVIERHPGEGEQGGDNKEKAGTLAESKKVSETKVSRQDSKASRRTRGDVEQPKLDEQKNSLQSLVRRKMRKFKASKSRDEDADSYILDLNDCLDREKLRVSTSTSASRSPSSSLSSISEAKKRLMAEEVRVEDGKQAPRQTATGGERETNEFSPLREISPIDDKWQTNKEYIPSEKHEANSKRNKNKFQGAPRTNAEARLARRQQKSPLLMEFLESHQIDTRASGDSLEAKSESSSCDSGASPCGWPPKAARAPPSRADMRLPPVSYYDELNASSLASSKLNELSESDRRLFHWRKLAARSVTRWQVPDESSSDEDDSDLGDFIDCQSPARVCYCSDDTSCSSVELIWSRPSGPPPSRPPVPGLQLHETSPARTPSARQLLTRPLVLLATPTPPSSTDLNLSPGSLSGNSLSPGRLLSVEGRASSGRHNSRSPTPSRLQVYNSHVMRYNNNYKAASNNNSLKSISSQSISCQKPSILELAKPSRARDRKIGETNHNDRNNNSNNNRNNNNNNRDGQRSRQPREHRTQAARRSMPAPPAPVDCSVATSDRGASATRDWSAVPVSRPASGSDWHPNPLFGRVQAAPARLPSRAAASRAQHATPTRRTPLESHKQTKSCDDSHNDELGGIVSPVMAARQSLRRHLSVDLQQQQREQAESERLASNSTKSSRFKSFLARIKRRDTSKSSEQVDRTARAGEEGQREAEGGEEEGEGHSTSLEKISVREPDEDLDEFNADDATSGFRGDRGRRQRWSLRMRSPFTSGQQTGENHAYLSHLVNLDKRIKSNVSSFKSHLGERLSDTGKRASVLADQLITSLKDTTKEQLLLATTGTPARDRYDTLPNSFASLSTTAGGDTQEPPEAHDPLLVQKQLLPGTQYGYSTGDRRAKLFSLIYMHQQQQATGKPVVTRQPTSGLARAVAAPSSSTATSNNNAEPNQGASSEVRESIAGVGYGGQLQGPPNDLEKLLDSKELLLDKFRALERECRAQRIGVHDELASNYQRLSKTIAPRDKDLARQALDASSTAGGPKRRSSCTV